MSRIKSKVTESEKSRKRLEKIPDKKYNKSCDNPACQKKGVMPIMASQQKTVRGNLYDDKGTWTVRARVFNPYTGKVQQRTKSTGFKVKYNTKRQAEKAMKEIVKNWENEANIIPIRRDPLFSECVWNWIDKKRFSLKANSIKSYEDYAKVHIIPLLGNIKVQAMTLKHLQIFYSDLLKRISVNSARKIHVVVSGALSVAVRDGIIPVNFATYVEFLKAKKFEGKAYNPAQVAALLEAVEKEGEPLHVAIVLAVVYGLRRSEICGLWWKDIYFAGKTLSVRNTKTQNGALVIESEQTKTQKSRRIINLIDSTIQYLKELKQTQEKNGLKLDKVCVWPDGREVQPNYITHRTSRIMEKYGLEHIRVHDLRHTAASLLATQATPKQVQNFLGHEDISTTMNTYTHLLEKERSITSSIMDNILKKSVFCSEKCSESK